jgi:hypothetical protein
LGNPDRLLYKMLRNASELSNQLSEIDEASRNRQPDLLLNVGARLWAGLAATAHAEEDVSLTLFGIQSAIYHLCNAIDLAVAGRTSPKGAPPRFKRYRGLDTLVFGLELTAHCCDGVFKVHRNAGPKGSLITALDEIRKCVLEDEDRWEYAEFLPLPDQHPVATYERLLRAARLHRGSRRISPFAE